MWIWKILRRKKYGRRPTAGYKNDRIVRLWFVGASMDSIGADSVGVKLSYLLLGSSFPRIPFRISGV